MDSSRLALGTVQFGIRYGIANTAGKVDVARAREIVTRARLLGVDTLDTAVAYGDSESVLGEIGVATWKVVSKLPPVPAGCTDIRSWVRQLTGESLERLGIARLHGLLLHAPEQLKGDSGADLYAALCSVRETGLTTGVGVSVYGPDELDALPVGFQFDIVQAPLNVIDRRLVNSGWLARLADAGVEVHVRSVFLQGLLLMHRASRPAKFLRWQSRWDLWDRWLEDASLSPVQACLAFVGSQPEVERIVVGVESAAQLMEIAGALQTKHVDVPSGLECADRDLVDPSRWGLA